MILNKLIVGEKRNSTGVLSLVFGGIPSVKKRQVNSLSTQPLSCSCPSHPCLTPNSFADAVFKKLPKVASFLSIIQSFERFFEMLAHKRYGSLGQSTSNPLSRINQVSDRSINQS